MLDKPALPDISDSLVGIDFSFLPNVQNYNVKPSLAGTVHKTRAPVLVFCAALVQLVCSIWADIHLKQHLSENVPFKLDKIYSILELCMQGTITTCKL